jgi:uncharacterized protein (TIGR02300 family)
MTKPELGTKRACVGCAVRFYDLSRVPPVCPKCGVAQPPDVVRPRYAGRPPGRAGGAPWRATPAAVPVGDEAESGEAAEVEDKDEADSVPDEDDEADTVDLDAEIPLHPGAPE